MQLIRRISVVCAAMVAISFAGCGGNSPSPAKSTGGSSGPGRQAGPAATREETPAAPVVSAKDPGQSADAPAESEPAQPASVSKASPVEKTPKPETAEDLFSKVQKLQEQLAQSRNREQFVGQQRSIIEIIEQVLSKDPEPELRDQARRAWFEAVAGRMGLTGIEGKGAAGLLEALDKRADAIIAEDPATEGAAFAHFFKIIGHLNVERDGSQNDPSVNKRLFEWTKTFAGQFPKDLKVGVALLSIGQNTVMDGQYDTARDIHQLALDLQLGGGITQQAEQTMQKLEKVGKPFPVSGPTLSGSEINIDELKGKVVLVDFWATWCGPCLDELPNVQEVYEKYHDQGFEILAVSLDKTKDALEKFVAQRKIPWAQIFFDEEDKRWWMNPVAVQYGIHGIPATFLVDREGNLARFEVRGPTLEPTVAELLKKTKSPDEK